PWRRISTTRPATRTRSSVSTPGGREPQRWRSSASVMERSNRYGYGSTPAPRRASSLAIRRSRSVSMTPGTLPALPRVDGVRGAVLCATAAMLRAATPSGDPPAAEPAPTPVAAVVATAPATVEPAVATDVISVYTARQLDDSIANAAIT